MAIIDLFSKRQRRLTQAGKADIFIYDEIPSRFRVQVTYIWRDALGEWSDDFGDQAEYIRNNWTAIHDVLAREFGEFSLGQRNEDRFARCVDFLMRADVLSCLDTIELTFRWIDRIVRKDKKRDPSLDKLHDSDNAIRELNGRFREHNLGFEYIDGEIFRKDTEFLHAETVKPAIALLQARGFEGAFDEFMRAFKHHREGAEKEAIAEALKSFESTIKIIAKARNWSFDDKATSSKLVDLIFEQKLLSLELQSQFTSLRSVLTSGIPTIRNKNAGHGQGSSAVAVPNYLAEYALHLTASAIVFLARAHLANP